MAAPLLTPDLCRAARALLGLTQDALAKEAKIGVRTLKAFETGKPPVAQESVDAIMKCLAAKGIELVSKLDGTTGVLHHPSIRRRRYTIRNRNLA
jgi:transcriptional regulator with XRE-family HTH domain